MKKKCCHVKIMCPNKSCSKDNLDQVIDMQQYNPLIHQQLRESKIQAAIHTFMLPLQGHEANPQSCLNQAVVQAKKYGPATIRETHIAVPEILGQVCFNTQQHFVAAGMERSVSSRLPSSKQMEDRSIASGKKTFKMTKVELSLSFPCVFPLNAF